MKFVKRLLLEIVRAPLMFIWKGLMGWTIDRETIEDDKIILTGSPHTSNWDYLHFLLAALSLRRKIYVTIKSELFFPPLGWILKALGGIPIDRHASHNFVEQLAEFIDSKERIVLLFTPDGTRSYRPHWKTGFYWVAVETGLPIMLGIPDFPKKHVHLNYKFMPTGDLEADFALIREQQDTYGVGLYPEKANPVITRSAYEARVMDNETDISAIEQTIEKAEQQELSA